MTMSPEVRILYQGPYGGNLTLKTQVRWGGALSLTAGRLGPVRERAEEAIGAILFRAQAKRREASAEGESASSDEAQYPWVRRAYGRRDRVEGSWSYPVRSVGIRASGRPKDVRT